MSNSQYKELLEFLLVRFEGIEERFERIERRLDVHDRRFDDHDRKFDAIFKEIVAFRQEFTVSNFRIGRIEQWVTKAAPKIGIPYNP